MKVWSKPRVGVSLCLRGELCRYDGGHTRHDLVEKILEPRCQLLPVCPEREIGLPVPREKLLLVGPPDYPTLVGEESLALHGDALRAFARQWIATTHAEGLHGFVLQSRSPSCGVGSTWRRERRESEPVRDGTGLFAEVLLELHPDLPIREDTALLDEAVCWKFLAAVEDYAGQQHSE